MMAFCDTSSTRDRFENNEINAIYPERRRMRITTIERGGVVFAVSSIDGSVAAIRLVNADALTSF